jgi:hypothetical protein
VLPPLRGRALGRRSRWLRAPILRGGLWFGEGVGRPSLFGRVDLAGKCMVWMDCEVGGSSKWRRERYIARERRVATTYKRSMDVRRKYVQWRDGRGLAIGLRWGFCSSEGYSRLELNRQ